MGFHYDILEKAEAGIVLMGSEVKSVKKQRVNLKGSYVSFHDNAFWLVNAHISPYQPKNRLGKMSPPLRERKLLLSRKEIDSLNGKVQGGGLTIVPVKVYNKGALLKVEIALVRGKKLFDKRASLKKREIDRKIRSALRQKE